MPNYRMVAGFPAYRVGDDGSVWSCWGRGAKPVLSDRWHRLFPSFKDDSPRVSLHGPGKVRRQVYVHILVREAFGVARAVPGGCPCDPALDPTYVDEVLRRGAWRTTS